jgi:hypothetical protein
MAIDDQLRALRAEADALAKRSDALNAEIARIEKALEGVGVGAWLDDREYVIDEQEDASGRIAGWLIGYAKIGGRWRLAAREFSGGTMVEEPDGMITELKAPVSNAPVALADAPRLVRVCAIGMMECLVPTLLVRVRRLTRNVDRALTRVARPKCEAPGGPDDAEFRIFLHDEYRSGEVFHEQDTTCGYLCSHHRDENEAGARGTRKPRGVTSYPFTNRGGAQGWTEYEPLTDGATAPHEVRVTGFEHNMAGWTAEKAGNVVRALHKIVFGVRATKDVPESVRELIEGAASGAMWDATKLLSLGSGQPWETSHRDTALRDEGGLKEIVRYYDGRPRRVRDIDDAGPW